MTNRKKLVISILLIITVLILLKLYLSLYQLDSIDRYSINKGSPNTAIDDRISIPSSIAGRAYKENYYNEAEKLFEIGMYKEASEYYGEYLQSLKYRNTKNRNNKVAFNRKLASELLFLSTNNSDKQKKSRQNIQETNNYFTIQVAAVKNKKGAYEIKQNLIQGGFSARVVKKENSKYNFILVGKFQKISEAKKLKSKMIKYFPNGRNVKNSIIKKIEE